MNDTLAEKRVFLTGLTGQDGYYLARRALADGGRVTAGVPPTDEELARARAVANELGPIEIHPLDLVEREDVAQRIRAARPDVVYHLAAQSSVGVSWRRPVETARINAMGTLHLLEALRHDAPDAAFVMAGSCDCYDHEAAGDDGVRADGPLHATNPYAASKVMAQQMTRCYREEFGLRASVAVLFNHTSPRRPEMFVERGIVRGAVRVALGQAPHLVVGSMDTRRDWSWAEDIVEGFVALGLQNKPCDLVLASGRVHTTGDWVREAFAQLGLDIERHVQLDASRLHAGDRPHTFGDIDAARATLGWTPRTDLAEMVRRLIAADRADLGRARE